MASSLADRLIKIPGVELVTPSFFNEFTIRLPKPAAQVVDKLVEEENIIAGVPASRLMPNDPQAANLLIVAATETTSEDDCTALADALAGVL
jgi:glycine dehydrogenase subunit 1